MEWSCFAVIPSVGTWLLPKPFNEELQEANLHVQASENVAGSRIAINSERNAQLPSLSSHIRLKPTNLETARNKFFASNCTEAPEFTYEFSNDTIEKYFAENCNVCFELLPEAKCIMQRMEDEYGGPEAFMRFFHGDEEISAQELFDAVDIYLRDLELRDKVDIRLVDDMLSVASVIKSSVGSTYLVKIKNSPCPAKMVQGICDHEIGTHLLRMMNDECQIWHGFRSRHNLADPWITEEGLATLNTYISMPSKLLYPQALNYFAVCRADALGFVELFEELWPYVMDPAKLWLICCRVKRGLIDTSRPGAFRIDQTYFKGAVQLLKHIEVIDFGYLYCGQIAFQDVNKMQGLLRKDNVLLPRFLSSEGKLRRYLRHCQELLKENQLQEMMKPRHMPAFRLPGKGFFDLVRPSSRGSISRRKPASSHASPFGRRSKSQPKARSPLRRRKFFTPFSKKPSVGTWLLLSMNADEPEMLPLPLPPPHPPAVERLSLFPSRRSKCRLLALMQERKACRGGRRAKCPSGHILVFMLVNAIDIGNSRCNNCSDPGGGTDMLAEACSKTASDCFACEICKYHLCNMCYNKQVDMQSQDGESIEDGFWRCSCADHD